MKVLIYAPWSKILCFSTLCCKKEGVFLSNNVVQVVDIISNFYMGHLPMKTKLNANIDYAIFLKWSQVK